MKEALAALRPHFSHLFFLSAFVGLMSLAPIAYMREVYGPVVTARSENTLVWVTVLLFMVLVLAGTLEWTRQRIQSAASSKLMQKLGTRALDVGFEANLVGKKSANSTLNDLRVLKNFISSQTFATFFEVPVGLTFLGLIYFINPLMGTVSVLGGILILVVGVLSERAARSLTTESMEAASRSSNLAVEATRNAQTIEAMGMAPAVLRRWGFQQSQFMVLNAGAGKKQAVGMAISKTVMLVQGSSMIGIGAALTLMGHVSPAFAGLFIVAKFIGAMAMRPFMQLIMAWRQIEMARQSYLRLDEALSSAPRKPTGMSMRRPSGYLAVTNAYVKPPGSKAIVLQGLNFDLNPGQILVVMGASGSGKSSLAKVITGLWSCSSGEARLDGVNLANWDKEELGKYLGYLPQDVELFDGTIQENIIRFGDFNSLEYERIVTLTGLREFLDSLPMGDQTELGDNAASLSGGQRQRVGLARALYGSPQLIVLDEPNSNLDGSGDLALWGTLQAERARGATIVLITHRTEVVKLADRVLMLKDGKQMVFGSADKVKEAFNKVNSKLEARKG